MSLIEAEARKRLLSRREHLSRGSPGLVHAPVGEAWRDWETQSSVLPELTRRELDEIEAALRRIDDGSFGRCEACGGPMGLQRLRAIPDARLCLSCSGERGELD